MTSTPTYWLNNLPTPPSVNGSLVPSSCRKLSPRTGQYYTGARMRPSLEMIGFKRQVNQYLNQHAGKLAALSRALKSYLDRGYVLRVDVYVVFHVERIFSSRNKKVLALDANNRVKASLDGVSELLEIDDKFFFRGDCEKVTTAQKDSECTMVRIQPVKPRTHIEILQLMRQELSALAPTRI